MTPGVPHGISTAAASFVMQTAQTIPKRLAHTNKFLDQISPFQKPILKTSFLNSEMCLFIYLHPCFEMAANGKNHGRGYPCNTDFKQAWVQGGCGSYAFLLKSRLELWPNARKVWSSQRDGSCENLVLVKMATCHLYRIAQSASRTRFSSLF